MKTLLCAGWKQSSCDDGPGIRSVFFLQGCSRHCPGCQNSCTHNKENGIVKTVDEITKEIVARCRNRKITISGGEPLEQLSSLIVLLGKLKDAGFNVCLYTGWDYSKVPQIIFKYLDYLKCGHFDINKMSPDLMYVGSTNQEMYRNIGGRMEKMNLVYSEACA